MGGVQVHLQAQRAIRGKRTDLRELGERVTCVGGRGVVSSIFSPRRSRSSPPRVRSAA